MHILIMLLLISLLILVHELGHFTAARLLKIRVDKFGFGLPFGPTLWEKKIGDVTYCVHAFLLGGYVSFPDDDPDSDIPDDDPSRLKNKKAWEKAIVFVAGVTANALLAFIIIIGVILFSQGVPTNQNKVFVSNLVKEVPVAKEAGMLPKDQILAINNVKINSFRDFKKILLANTKNDGFVTDNDAQKQLKKIIYANPKLFKELKINTARLDSETIKKLQNLVIPPFIVINIPEADSEEFLIPNLKDPFSSTEVLPITDKLSVEETALKNGIVKNKFAGDGKTTLGEIARVSADTKHDLDILVLRKGKEKLLTLAPNTKGQIGIRPEIQDVYVPLTSVGQIFTGSWDYLYENTFYMCLGLYKIFTGQVDLREIHGVVLITKIGGDIIKNNGLRDGWILTALISIDLAIVNLLPIPALDGGHLMFLLLEKLRGRPIDENYQEAFTKYGFLFLIGLMVLIVFNDILVLVTGKF